MTAIGGLAIAASVTLAVVALGPRRERELVAVSPELEAVMLRSQQLERALASGRLGGVGLDTYWNEPWDPSDPLFGREDVVTLPHIAGSTEEAFARIAEIVADNVARLLDGRDLLHRVA